MVSIIHLTPARRFTGNLAAKRTGLGMPGAMLQRLEGRVFGVNALQFNAIGPAPLTQAAFAQDGHVVADANSAYAIDRKSEDRLIMTNLFERKCIAHRDGFVPPLSGTARVRYRREAHV